MSEQHTDFRYESLPEIPKEYRRVDWTLIEVHEKPFSDAVEAFNELREYARGLSADKPFLHLHFLRAIEDCLMNLAIDKKEPVGTCLEILRRRLDLEYGRYEIYGKAARAVVFAGYADRSGERDLARRILKAEAEQLKGTAETCREWLEAVEAHLDKLLD